MYPHCETCFQKMIHLNGKWVKARQELKEDGVVIDIINPWIGLNMECNECLIKRLFGKKEK